jgi:hypothetical protein
MPRKPKRSLPERFPAPGPKPRFDLPPREEQERERMQNELFDWEMRNRIHTAMHTNDPHARAELAGFVRWLLFQGLPVRAPVREWLSWVLMRLSARDKVPHLATGNAIKTDERIAFIRQLVDVMQALPPGRVTARLKQAAKTLHVSFETVRLAYYSDSYRSWLLVAKAESDSKKTPGR